MCVPSGIQSAGIQLIICLPRLSGRTKHLDHHVRFSRIRISIQPCQCIPSKNTGVRGEAQLPCFTGSAQGHYEHSQILRMKEVFAKRRRTYVQPGRRCSCLSSSIFSQAELYCRYRLVRSPRPRTTIANGMCTCSNTRRKTGRPAPV